MDLGDYLRIYLSDHRAAQTAMVRVVRRVARSNRSTPWAEELAALADELAADAAVLVAVAEAAGVRSRSIKQLMAVAAERLGLLKLNGHIFTYSPLSRVIEMEALTAALTLKRSMWETLGLLQNGQAELSSFDFAPLADKAKAQAERLEPVHRWAVHQLPPSSLAD